jgi:putative intracellular protease/amidase
MLEYTIIEPDGILRLQPSGALTVGDFEGLTRFTDAYLSTHAHLAGMLVEAREFPGWDSFAALASHVRFIRRHERRIARVALVTDSSIAHVVGTLAEPFAAADIRSFDSHEAGDALEWLRSYRRMAFNVLIVLTSHDRLGDTGRPTGFWLEELAAPYYVFLDAGVGMTLASPKGGRPPLDPASDRPDSATDATRRFKSDHIATAVLDNTLPLRDIQATDFDAVFYPGGHGPLWDLAADRDSIALIETTVKAGKPLGAVCHAPGILRQAVVGGLPIVSGKRVTGFSNTEEQAVGLSNVVPFLVEDMLRAEGGIYSKAPDWQVHVVTDGLLTTGQNPASSGPAARALLTQLQSLESPIVSNAA